MLGLGGVSAWAAEPAEEPDQPLGSSLPIGSTDPNGVTDSSAVSGITSGNEDGLLVAAPPQSQQTPEPIDEGGRTGPDPVDIAQVD